MFATNIRGYIGRTLMSEKSQYQNMNCIKRYSWDYIDDHYLCTALLEQCIVVFI